MDHRLASTRTAATALAALALVAVVLPTTGTVANGSTPSADPGSAAEALADQLADDPSGQVVGNTIRYPDGEVFVAVDAATYSLSQCANGQFCIWSSTGYTGAFTYRTGAGVTHNLNVTVGSFYNNRARAAWLYSNTGTSTICYLPRDMRASVSSSYSSAQKVLLSNTKTC